MAAVRPNEHDMLVTQFACKPVESRSGFRVVGCILDPRFGIGEKLWQYPLSNCLGAVGIAVGGRGGIRMRAARRRIPDTQPPAGRIVERSVFHGAWLPARILSALSWLLGRFPVVGAGSV